MYEQADKQASEQASEQPNEQADEHIITTLHLYYLYINNNIGAERFPESSEQDRMFVKKILQRLDTYAEEETINRYFSEKQRLEVLVQYYVVKEIYFSPYRMIFRNITRKDFILTFKKTEKYINLTKKTAKRFIEYFIKSLQNLLEGATDDI